MARCCRISVFGLLPWYVQRGSWTVKSFEFRDALRAARCPVNKGPKDHVKTRISHSGSKVQDCRGFLGSLRLCGLLGPEVPLRPFQPLDAGEAHELQVTASRNTFPSPLGGPGLVQSTWKVSG